MQMQSPSLPDRRFAGNCEHVAAVLKSAEEVPIVVASFLQLGAARNGWLVHGSRPGEAAVDGERLEKAGLAVRTLTARGQLQIMDLDLAVSPGEWVVPWSEMLDERMDAGYDALWFSRFPVRMTEDEVDAVLPFEEAWMRCFTGRRVVTLCPYIVGDVAADPDASHLRRVADVHDRLEMQGAT